MNSKRLYFLLIGVIIASVLGTTAVVVYANKFLKNESIKLNTARSMGQKNDLLIAKYNQISTNSLYWQQPSRDLYTTITNMLPTNKSQAEAVGLIQQLAEQNAGGLSIASITFQSSDLGATSAAIGNTSNTSSTNTTPTPAATAKITQSKPLKDVAGIAAIETKISLKPVGTGAIDYASFLRFIDGLTNNTRLMQVTELSVMPDLKGADIVVNILVKQ